MTPRQRRKEGEGKQRVLLFALLLGSESEHVTHTHRMQSVRIVPRTDAVPNQSWLRFPAKKSEGAKVDLRMHMMH